MPLSEYPSTHYTDSQTNNSNEQHSNKIQYIFVRFFFNIGKVKLFFTVQNYFFMIYVNTYASYGLKSNDCDNSLKWSAFSDTEIKI
jgi:hypothetical protein